MNMKNKNAHSRMQALFVQCHCFISNHRFKWILEDNQKFAVTQVLSAIRPLSPKKRLQPDLILLHHETKKDFKEFLNHVLKVWEAFKIV